MNHLIRSILRPYTTYLKVKSSLMSDDRNNDNNNVHQDIFFLPFYTAMNIWINVILLLHAIGNV